MTAKEEKRPWECTNIERVEELLKEFHIDYEKCGDHIKIWTVPPEERLHRAFVLAGPL